MPTSRSVQSFAHYYGLSDNDPETSSRPDVFFNDLVFLVSSQLRVICTLDIR